MKMMIPLLLVFCLAPLSVSANDVYGTVMVSKGDVKVLAAKLQGKEEAAKVGKKVFPGDTIIAGVDSRAKIIMSDKNVINISPDSRITIAKYENNGTSKNVELNVSYGKVRATVEQQYDGEKNKFNIRTPTAVAGVRGTDFLTGFNRTTQVTQVTTFSGVVAVGIPGQGGRIQNAVFVRPGQSTNVSNGQAPEAPKVVPRAELDQINKDATAEAGQSGTSSSDAKPDAPAEKGEQSEQKDQDAKKEQPKEASEQKQEPTEQKDAKKEPSGDKKEAQKDAKEPQPKDSKEPSTKKEAQAEQKQEPRSDAKSETKKEPTTKEPTKEANRSAPAGEGGGSAGSSKNARTPSSESSSSTTAGSSTNAAGTSGPAPTSAPPPPASGMTGGFGGGPSMISARDFDPGISNQITVNPVRPTGPAPVFMPPTLPPTNLAPPPSQFLDNAVRSGQKTHVIINIK